MAKSRMRISYWINKFTDTQSVHVIIIAFPLKQWLGKHASFLRFTYIAVLFSLAVYEEVLKLGF